MFARKVVFLCQFAKDRVEQQERHIQFFAKKLSSMATWPEVIKSTCDFFYLEMYALSMVVTFFVTVPAQLFLGHLSTQRSENHPQHRSSIYLLVFWRALQSGQLDQFRSQNSAGVPQPVVFEDTPMTSRNLKQQYFECVEHESQVGRCRNGRK